jgi:hypothetical protein
MVIFAIEYNEKDAEQHEMMKLEPSSMHRKNVVPTCPNKKEPPFSIGA